MDTQSSHPAAQWQQAVAQPTLPTAARLRLATALGHMQQDVVLARRAALIDLLAEGKPLTQPNICQRVEIIVGDGCWGKRPKETLVRDIQTLKRGGIRIAYSRQKNTAGYYLQYPPIEKKASAFQEPPLPKQILEAMRNQSADQKLSAAFALADFALQQKQQLLAHQHPKWSAEQINQQARAQVFGTGHLMEHRDF